MRKQLSGETEIETFVKAEEETKDKARVQGEDEPEFTKEQLLNSKKYCDNKDILSALLTEGESYTHSEVNRITEKFLKGDIK
ncbi:MAG: hypothetical protein VB018_00960 [Lachnospiraceae bacterium]|nr:hypothetical protein [Lachnospiraceae bacterium]